MKAAAGHLAKNIAEETIDEAGSPIGKYRHNKPMTQTRYTENVGRQAAAGAVLGAGMGSVQTEGLYFWRWRPKTKQTQTTDDLAKAIIRSVQNKIFPNNYQDSFNAFEDAKQA